MTTDHPPVVARGVTRRFGATTALDGVSLSIPGPGIYGLLGRNGAGKTLLMSIITGQDRASEGTVRVLGEDPFESAAVARSLSFFRDNQRYPADFTLKHLLKIAPAFHARWDAEQAARLVDLFRLPSKPRIRKYSRGQLSAVGCMVGLAARAPLTLLDEPYLGLDATARQYFYEALVEDFAKVPRTIIVSTHLIEEMAPLLQHIFVLARGKVVLDSETGALDDYAYTISGARGAVQRAVDQIGSAPLASRTVGGLATATLRGPVPQGLAASAPGLAIEPATLQQIINALGQDPADTGPDAPADAITEGSRS